MEMKSKIRSQENALNQLTLKSNEIQEDISKQVKKQQELDKQIRQQEPTIQNIQQRIENKMKTLTTLELNQEYLEEQIWEEKRKHKELKEEAMNIHNYKEKIIPINERLRKENEQLINELDSNKQNLKRVENLDNEIQKKESLYKKLKTKVNEILTGIKTYWKEQRLSGYEKVLQWVSIDQKQPVQKTNTLELNIFHKENPELELKELREIVNEFEGNKRETNLFDFYEYEYLENQNQGFTM